VPPIGGTNSKKRSHGRRASAGGEGAWDFERTASGSARDGLCAIPQSEDSGGAAGRRGVPADDHVRNTAGVAYDEDLADRIWELLAGEPDVNEKRMFGGLAFLVGGRMSVAASGQGGLMVRVEPDQTDALVTKPHTRPFEMQGVRCRAGCGSMLKGCGPAAPGWLRSSSVQRCVRHKERNVLDHLPERDRPAVKRRLRRAGGREDHVRAEQELRVPATETLTSPASAPAERSRPRSPRRTPASR